MTSPAQSRRPNFLILGVAKCGSTSLFAYLEQHPDVFFSRPKEPVFFEAQYQEGLEFYWREYFAGYRGESAIGEARTHNLLLPFVPGRVHESIPDAKLVAIVRDPIDRAYSHWWHRHSRGLERLGLRAALEANLERIRAGSLYEGPEGAERWKRSLIQNATNWSTRYGHYLDLGYYAVQLERYLALFPRSQLLVVLFEDLSRSPQDVCRQVWEFLGVDAEQHLADPAPRNVAVERKKGRLLRKISRVPIPPLASRIIPEPVKDLWRALLAGRPASRPAIDPETESWLLDHFAPHNRALEALMGRELSAWFEPKPSRTSPARGSQETVASLDDEAA
ncbi:MAG: sulfotransferase domain-containing protein [Proteobacteria bacterium]|nr:sulfotransferase domain-containing protein [Pseudomonadota bacterium]